MDYNQTIYYLEHALAIHTVPTLDRMRKLMALLGNPQEALTVIHIAGTNGKGSASAMLSSVLHEAGYSVGTYISPHLFSYCERISVDKADISETDFTRSIGTVQEAVKDMCGDGTPLPNLFEVVTAAAFLYFAEKMPDFLVMEVGLGGLTDATNVVSHPLLSVIMSIGLDHTAFLGNTVAEIAVEKAGIIKKNCPVVLYSQDELVYNIVERIARERQAPLVYCVDSQIEMISQTLEGTFFSVENSVISYEAISLPLLGNHQVRNCITVLEACQCLREKGIRLEKDAILKGIANTRWVGRLEVVQKNPLVLLDGAHNPDGMVALGKALETYFPDEKITLLMGVLKEKDAQTMLASILPKVSKIIFTEPDSDRKSDTDDLSALLDGYPIEVYQNKNFAEAYEQALTLADSSADSSKTIVCCGSLYLVGALSAYISQKKSGGDE